MIFFSAHGVPLSYVQDAGDPYKDQMEECISLIMAELKYRGIVNQHTLAYQVQDFTNAPKSLCIFTKISMFFMEILLFHSLALLDPVVSRRVYHFLEILAEPSWACSVVKALH